MWACYTRRTGGDAHCYSAGKTFPRDVILFLGFKVIQSVTQEERCYGIGDSGNHRLGRINIAEGNKKVGEGRHSWCQHSVRRFLESTLDKTQEWIISHTYEHSIIFLFMDR